MHSPLLFVNETYFGIEAVSFLPFRTVAVRGGRYRRMPVLPSCSVVAYAW